MKVAAVTCSPPNTAVKIAKFVATAQIRYIVQRKEPQQWGEWMRKEITTMGPTFIKMGQFFSTRSDLFDKEITKEFAKLQDDITPIDIASVHHVIQESYNKPWNEVFEIIDTDPIACASIGQVHIATLKGTKQRVVIKVQKPCVAHQIVNDIATLKDMNRLLSILGSSRTREVDNVLQQYERFLSAELDYREEMRHMLHFRSILEDLPVCVPRVYKELCTNEVLVMEYVPSIKIDDIHTLRQQGVDTTAICDNLVTIFLHMIVYHGAVHCDPHPGNLGVLPDGETIVLYDFGNVTRLSKEFCNEINNIIFAVYQKDVDEFVDILLKLKIIQLTDDVDTLEVRMFFRSFFEYLETLNMQSLQTSLKQQLVMSSGSSNFAQMKVDPDFLALFRVFSLLDGTCSKLDPKFNYITSISPFMQTLMSDFTFFDIRVKKDIEKLTQFPKVIKMTEQTVIRTQKQVNRLSTDTQKLEYIVFAVACISQMDHAYAIPLFVGMFMLWKLLK